MPAGARAIPSVPSEPVPRAARLTRRREAQLIRAAQRGDTDAVERLFAAYWPMCHRAAWLIVRDAPAAEDIAQEAFLSAIAALDRFDRARPLGPWLRTIVARRAIDFVRARSVRREVDDEPLLSVAAPEVAPERPGPALVDALERLTPERRAVIVLRYLLDLTPTQIAGVLQLPVGTVNSRMRRALDDLRATAEVTGDE